MKCRKCGTENPEDAKFCENCGSKMGKGNRNMMLLGIAVIAIIIIAAVGLSGFIKPVNTALTLNNTTNSSNSANNPDVNAQRQKCPDCGGSGTRTCQYCGGSGKVICQECGGDHIIEVPGGALVCNNCNDGYVRCYGGQAGCDRGKYRCPRCNGDGYLDSGDGMMT